MCETPLREAVVLPEMKMEMHLKKGSSCQEQETHIFTVPSGKREGKATSGAEMKANGGVRASSERNNDTYECFESENRRHAFCLHFVGKPLVGGEKLLF